MPIRVNNNIAAINAQHAIGHNSTRMYRQLGRLASGLRVNRAVDDASGLVVSEGMRSELAGLGQNVRNAEQASDLLQVAEGSLQVVNDVLVRMRELAMQSSSSTVNDSNREALAAEFTQLTAEIDRVAEATQYNSTALLIGFGYQVDTAGSTAITSSPTTGVAGASLSAAPTGTFTFVDAGGDSLLSLGNGLVTQTLNLGPQLDGGGVATGTTVVANFDRLGIRVSLAGVGAGVISGDYRDGDLGAATLLVEGGTGGVFQVGPKDSFVNRLEVGLPDLRASGNELDLGHLSISSLTTARQALTGLDQAIVTVAAERGKLGSLQNRLEFAISYNENEIVNIRASDASIRDADMALEVTEYSRYQILTESSNAMLMQANVGAVQALSLL